MRAESEGQRWSRVGDDGAKERETLSRNSEKKCVRMREFKLG